MWEEIIQFWKNCYHGHPLGYKKAEVHKMTHEERMEERKKRREKR